MNSMIYLIKQGIKNTYRNSVMSLACIGVLFSCLMLIGFSVLLSLNLDNVISDIEQQNEVIIFLSDNCSDEEVNEISELLEGLPYISTFEFVNKDEALEKHIRFINLKNSENIFESLKEDNPLPDTFNVVLSDLSEMESFIDEIEDLDVVEQVNAPLEIAKMIVSIKNVLHIAGIVIVFILFLVSLVIISNTIKLTIYNRRKEINIMKFVGASDFFIKLPFIVEGISIGLISAISAYLSLWYGYNYLISKMSDIKLQWIINLYNNIVPFSVYNMYILSFFLGVSLFIGIMGSSFFVKKYLKV